jgi:hypothetical protein
LDKGCQALFFAFCRLNFRFKIQTAPLPKIEGKLKQKEELLGWKPLAAKTEGWGRNQRLAARLAPGFEVGGFAFKSVFQ